MRTLEFIVVWDPQSQKYKSQYTRDDPKPGATKGWIKIHKRQRGKVYSFRGGFKWMVGFHGVAGVGTRAGESQESAAQQMGNREP